MTDEAALAALLRPWWDVFPPNNALQVQCDPWKPGLRKKLYALRVDVPTPSTGVEATWRRQLNAIELLLLALQVNPRAFMRLARTNCSLSPAYGSWSEVDEDEMLPCRLMIVFEDTLMSPCYPMWHRDALRLLLSPELHAFDWRGFHETRQALLAMASTPRERRRCETMKIFVCTRFLFLKEEPVCETLMDLVTIQHKRSSNNQSISGEREYPFQAEAVELVYATDILDRDRIAFSYEMLDSVKRLVTTDGAVLRWMHLLEVRHTREDHQHREIMGDFIRAITATQAGVTRGSTYHLGTQVIETVTTDPGSFSCLCSGLMHSRGVEHVTLDGVFVRLAGGTDPILKWYWIIYSLFHASATHSITSLEIHDTNLLTEHARYVRGLIQASQPVTLIYDVIPEHHSNFEWRSTPQPGSLVVLADDAPLFFTWQTNAVNTSSLNASADAKPFRVIYAFGSAVSILVPGYGQCWVRRRDIVSMCPDPFQDQPEHQWKLKTHRVTHLNITLEDETQDMRDSVLGVFTLLELIGEPITSLTIDFPCTSSAYEVELSKLWSCCPNLTELSLNCTTLTSFDELIDAYESGACQVTSLDLCACCMLTESSVVSLAAALGDHSMAIAQTLRHLRIELEEDDLGVDQEVDEEGDFKVKLSEKDKVVPFLSALELNDRLSYFELCVSEDVKQEYHDSFYALDGRLIVYPLSSRAKCAFLSVVRRAQKESEEIQHDVWQGGMRKELYALNTGSSAVHGADTKCTEDVETMTIQVCVRLLFLTEEPVNAVIKRLIHLKQARPKKYRNPERKDVGRRRSEFPFHAESIYLVYDYTLFDAHRPAVTPTMVSTLKALLKTKGLSVRQCRFIEFMRDTLRDESEYRFIGGDLWKSLTGAPTGVGRGLNDRQGAQVIESVMTPVPHFSALCSALMYSRGVKHLTLEGVFVRSAYEDEHLIKWRWIIYALFHASATHSIRSLEIRDIEIVMEHLVHVREFLDAPQPLKMMYPKEREPPNSAALLSTPIVGSFVALAEHAPVYFRWNPLNSEKNLVASSANTQFRVVNS
ncbi:hypothetical protein Poli38472_006752 [Pythium oligandrum]|uniref:Uncharacterized protein n=1 Tax=Pythium oligandrum TaxID=41045 RepID=A0A8K1C641_PYTOL|nr:hypothetical protein Poli38472_006752 [Pythium oligandrum]|eukprot:TMW56742.1 hypothetical protein Poli38472_006752 [Pythium oligandrum]